jgi:hypothetical protein
MQTTIVVKKKKNNFNYPIVLKLLILNLNASLSSMINRDFFNKYWKIYNEAYGLKIFLELNKRLIRLE